MKIVNLGNNSLIIKDIRGNKIVLNTNEQADVTESTALMLRNRYKILIIEEKKVVEAPVVEEVKKVKKAKTK